MRDGGIVICSDRLANIFDDQATAAHASEQIIQPMQIFGRTVFTIRLIDLSWQRSCVVILDANDKLLAFVAMADLQTGRLLVLADVDAVIAQHSGDFGIHWTQVRYVTAAHRLVHDVESGVVQHSQIVHRRANCLNVQASTTGFTFVQLQHSFADINDSHASARYAIEHRLPTTAGCQAQYLQSGHRLRQPAPAIQDLQRAAAFFVRRHFGKQTAVVGQAVPDLTIVRLIICWHVLLNTSTKESLGYDNRLKSVD